MAKQKLLLLDANIVIRLFALEIWGIFIDRCEVYLAKTIVDEEAKYYEDKSGRRITINLESDIQSGKISVFELLVSDIRTFRAGFDPSYLERLDPGETESLVYLFGQPEDTPLLICSADSIVFKILGNLKRTHQGISLEEILDSIGLSQHLEYQFTKTFREHWSRAGLSDSLGGIGYISED